MARRITPTQSNANSLHKSPMSEILISGNAYTINALTLDDSSLVAASVPDDDSSYVLASAPTSLNFAETSSVDDLVLVGDGAKGKLEE